MRTKQSIQYFYDFCRLSVRSVTASHGGVFNSECYYKIDTFSGLRAICLLFWLLQHFDLTRDLLPTEQAPGNVEFSF